MNVLSLLFGGWSALARLYPDREIAIDQTYSESSLYFGGSLLGSYRSCISVSVGPTGLRLRVPVVSSKWILPPIVVGWSDIERCDSARFGLHGDALKLWIRGWRYPVYLGRFLWKYGEVCSELKKRWNMVRSQERPEDQQGGPANRSQPSSPEANRTSSAAAPRRSP